MATVGEIFISFGLSPDTASFAKGERLLSGIKKAAIGLGIGAGVRGIVKLVEHSTEAATHLVSLSASIGLNIKQTQLWGAVAAASGSNLKELSVGLNSYERNLKSFAAGQGGKALAQNMKEMGISRGDAKKIVNGGSEGLNEHLLQVADKMKALGANSSVALATMTKLFGVRAGRALIADLQRGSDGIKEIMAKREAMGLLTTQQATGLRDLGIGMRNVKTAFSAIADQAIAKMAPGLLKLAESATKWMEANRELISGALSTAVDVVAGAFEALGTVIAFIADHGDETMAVIYGLAAAMLFMGARAAWAGRQAIWMWIKTVGPTALIIAAFALIAFVVIKLRKHFGDLVAILGGVALAFAIAWIAGLGPIALIAIGLVALIALAYEFRDALKDAWDDFTDSEPGDAMLGMGKYKGKSGEEREAMLRKSKADKDSSRSRRDNQSDKSSPLGDFANQAKSYMQNLMPKMNMPGGGGGAGKGKTEINIQNGATNVTLNGVKDGEAAAANINKLGEEAIQRSLRHASNALGKGR